MGWGGSVQTMINTLKANNDLLAKRKILFERDKTFGSTRKRYTKASAGILKGPTATPADLRKIRDRVVKQRKREVLTTAMITLFVVVIVSTGVHILYGNYVSQNLNERKQNQVNQEVQQPQEYKANMEEGLQKMEAKNYFFAVGNFSEALNKVPNDSLAEYQLAYAYCLLCKIEQKGCDRANRLVERFSHKYPRNPYYELLKANYLQAP